MRLRGNSEPDLLKVRKVAHRAAPVPAEFLTADFADFADKKKLIRVVCG